MVQAFGQEIQIPSQNMMDISKILLSQAQRILHQNNVWAQITKKQWNDKETNAKEERKANNWN
jgi:thiamine monophosphate kinase